MSKIWNLINGNYNVTQEVIGNVIVENYVSIAYFNSIMKQGIAEYENRSLSMHVGRFEVPKTNFVDLCWVNGK